jgi:hypothetical protein
LVDLAATGDMVVGEEGIMAAIIAIIIAIIVAEGDLAVHMEEEGFDCVESG